MVELSIDLLEKYEGTFGATAGMAYLRAGLSFADAQAKHQEEEHKALKTDNDDLKKQLSDNTAAHATALSAKDAELKASKDEVAALKAGGSTPVPLSDDGADGDDGQDDTEKGMSAGALAQKWKGEGKFASSGDALEAVWAKYPDKKPSDHRQGNPAQ